MESFYVKPKKPLMWWWHKIWAEFWYWFEQNVYHFFYFKYGIELPMLKWCSYYYHLNKMCDKYGINLYGEQVYKKQS